MKFPGKCPQVQVSKFPSLNDFRVLWFWELCFQGYTETEMLYWQLRMRVTVQVVMWSARSVERTNEIIAERPRAEPSRLTAVTTRSRGRGLQTLHTFAGTSAVIQLFPRPRPGVTEITRVIHQQ